MENRLGFKIEHETDSGFQKPIRYLKNLFKTLIGFWKTETVSPSAFENLRWGNFPEAKPQVQKLIIR